MGCGGSSAKKAPPPAGACKLTLKNNSSMMADKGFSLYNETKEKVMEFKHCKEDKSTQAVDIEAKNVMDDSLLMYVCTEVVNFNMVVPGNLKQSWADDLKSGWIDEKKVVIKQAHPIPGAHEWQIEIKATVYSDATKSKELASINMKGQGGSCYYVGDEENGYNTSFLDGIKYSLVVGGADVPVEHTSLKGSGGAGIQLKTDLFTLDATLDSSFKVMEETHKGSGQTRRVSINKTGDEAVLGAVLGGVIGMDLLPITIKFHKVHTQLPAAEDLQKLGGDQSC